MRRLFSEETCLWFEREIGTPTPVQTEGWAAIADGADALIAAPTGSGKTLTAFLTAIDRLKAQIERGEAGDETRVLYISPLKALGNDIRENLRRPIEGLNAPVRIAVRNGDTTPSERQAIAKRPPHILITTPESLYLMLTSASGRRVLSTVRMVIVDELHAMISERRGTHLALSLARLDALTGAHVQRVGLSATVRPLELAAKWLGGEGVRIVAPSMEKAADVRVLSDVADASALPQGSVWPAICRSIYEASLASRTVLVFCEGRATAEKVAHGVNALGGDGWARAHHGSVSRERRLEAERALKAGELKVLCATSSMELGIDVGDVDLVMQVGCPRRISSAVQRLGRAGHRPGEVSRMEFYPRMRAELLTAGLTAQAVREGAIERVEPQELCMDILAQHLVSMAVAEPYTVGDALAMIRRCWCYRDLTEARLRRVLEMLAGDDEHEADRPVSPRVEYDRIGGTVRGTGYSRMLALSSGGTIPDRGMYAVMLEDNRTRLGELDEEFVYEARLGDRFTLGAFAWQIERIERDRVIVRQSSPEGAQAPFWRGDGTGRDAETGHRFGAMLRRLEDAFHAGTARRLLAEWTEDEGAAEIAARYVEDQLKAVGCLATDRTLVLERFVDSTGEAQLMIHCPLGGRVNQALAILLRAEAAERTGSDVRAWFDDDGVLLMATGGEIPEDLMTDIAPEEARERLMRELPGTTLFSVMFRYNMNRALMMGVRSGGRVPLWVQRMRGAEALARAIAHPGHPMLTETIRDCMERHIDAEAAEALLSDIRAGRVRLVTRVDEGRPSPMTLSLRRQAEAELMYDYAPSAGMASGLTVTDDAEPTVAPDAEQLAQAHAGVKPPESVEKLHEKLMIEGDLLAEEAEAPFEWMSRLLDEGRAAYVEPGLWIAAEQLPLYEAMAAGDGEAARRVLRRCLRYRGPMTERELSDRYAGSDLSGALEALLESGEARVKDGQYVHAETWRRAQRMTIRARRRAVETAEPRAYAAWLASRANAAGSPAERLAEGIRRLYGLYLPVDQWEGILLPARTAGYRGDMLDALLSAGEAVWRLSGDGQRLAFFPPEEIDWEAEAPENEPSEAAKQVRSLLKRRGASFLSAVSACVTGVSAAELLRRMALAGDVACDSFAPLRKRAATASVRARTRGRLAGAAGRWELARPIRQPDMAERIERAFERFGILCRETAQIEGIRFSDALTLLRQMEYTGQARRGYFVRGLSGAQFVRAADFSRITAALARPDDAVICLSAADPMQAWGGVLRHEPGRELTRVPGTAVALRGGEVKLLLERQGAALADFGAEISDYEAVAEAFRAGRLYPGLRMMTVKNYPAEAAPKLEKAGFTREMRDYVLEAGAYGRRG